MNWPLINKLNEQVNPLANQHDLRKRAVGMINAAKKALGRPSDASMIIGWISKNVRDAKREEIEAVRTLLGAK